MSDREPPLTDPWSFPSEPEARAAERHVAQLLTRVRGAPLREPDLAGTPRLRTVGICGAGWMGTGIAQAAWEAGLSVTLHDASAEALERAGRTLARGSAPARPPRSERLRLSVTPEPLAACDLLIESVVENRGLKQQVLQRLTPRLSATALVATNTSTIPLAELAAAVADPARFCGLHFCYPVAERLAVEVIPSADMDPDAFATAWRFVRELGKVPVRVQDSPGFVVNRLLLPYLNEALEMLCDQVALTAIDRAARAFGMQWGPFETFDMIGLDTAMRAGHTFWEAFPDRITRTPILPRLVKLGRLGRKAGRGFYQYAEGGCRGEPDSTLDAILAPYRRRPTGLDQRAIVARLILPMLLEATRVLAEGLVQHPHDVDILSVFGLAFPRARGGLLRWADGVGAARLVDCLQPLTSLGTRMHPTSLLRSLADSGGSFDR